MAGKNRKLVVEILGEAKGFTKATKEAEKGLEGLGKKVGGLADGIKGAFVGTAIASFAATAVKAASEDSAAQARLAKTIQNTTNATADQIEAVHDSIAAMERQYAVADDDLRPAFETLVRKTKDVTEANKLMAVALDVAAGSGKNVQDVALALVQAQNGQTRALKALGIELKDAEGKALDFDQILQNLATTFQGQAALSAETAEGKTRALGIAFDNLKENIGMALLPVMEQLVGYLQAALDWFNNLPPGVQSLITQFAMLGGVGYVAVKMFNSVKGAVEGLRAAMVGSAGLAGALGAVGAVIGVAVLAYSVYSTRKAEARQRTKDLAAALREEGDAQKTALEQLIRNDESVAHMAEGLKILGLTWEDIGAAVNGTAMPEAAGKIAMVRQVLDDTTGSVRELDELWKALGANPMYDAEDMSNIRLMIEELDKLIGAKEKDDAASALLAATTRDELAPAIVETSTAATNAVAPVDGLSVAFGQTAIKAGEAVEKAAALEQQLLDLYNTVQSAVDAQFAMEDSIIATQAASDAAIDAYLKLASGTGNAKENTKQFEDAMRTLERSVDSQADAAVRLAEDMAATEGKTLSASEKAAIYEQELDKAATTSDAAATAVQRLKDKLDKLPSVTRVGIEVDVYGDPIPSNRGTVGVRAVGGSVMEGGLYKVNDRGAPEVLDYNGETYLIMGGGRGQVIPAAGGSGIGGGGGGGTTVIQLVLDGTVVTEVVHEGLLRKKRQSGDLRLN